MTGMAVARLAVALLLHLLLAASCCVGREFIVGGRGGWTTHPAEPFNHWAERNRFQVNDSLGMYTLLLVQLRPVPAGRRNDPVHGSARC
jgi:hypothetical protein